MGFRLRISAVILALGTFSGGLLGCNSAAVNRFPAGDRLATTLDGLKSYLLAQRKGGDHWSGTFTSDVTSDAIALALGFKIGKLSPELQAGYVDSMSARMTGDRRGWAAYPGGAADYSDTAVALLALQSVGVGPSDPRFQSAWSWFESQGGTKKIPLYARLMLAPLDLVPKSSTPSLTPKIFGMPSCFPIQLDREAFIRGLLVPSIAIRYLESLPERALMADAHMAEEWAQQEPQMGHYSIHHADHDGWHKCVIPDRDVDAFLEHVSENPQRYRQCVFYPEGKGEGFFSKLKNLFRSSGPDKLIDVLNFVVDRSVTGTQVFWIEQALILELQLRNPGGDWYTIGFTMAGIRLLQEAERVGLGDFSNEIDQAWTGLQSMRVVNQDGIAVQQWVHTGIWDTASTLLAFSPLKGTPWALSDSDAAAAVSWLVAHSVRDDQTAQRGWSFDETDSSLPDVDDTALALGALSQFMPDSDPTKAETLKEGMAFVRAHQNGDGGFPSWSTSVARYLVKLLRQKVVNVLADFSQPDVTGRVLVSDQLAGASVAADAATARSESRACHYLTHDMPRMKDRPLKLGQGNWMVNYVYSAASVLSGEAAAHCGAKEEAELYQFILQTQQAGGGWGESPQGYDTSTYVEAPPTIMQTSVALVGLIAYDQELSASTGAPPELTAAIEHGVDFLIDATQEGAHPVDEAFSGVLVTGVTYARYELAPAYLALYVLASWERLRQN